MDTDTLMITICTVAGSISLFIAVVLTLREYKKQSDKEDNRKE